RGPRGNAELAERSRGVAGAERAGELSNGAPGSQAPDCYRARSTSGRSTLAGHGPADRASLAASPQVMQRAVAVVLGSAAGASAPPDPIPGAAAMSPSAMSAVHTVLVFSQDPDVREQVRTALGPRPAADVGRIQYVEAATGDEVVALVDAGGIDVAILDG